MPLIMFSIVAFWGGYCWGEGGIASPPSTCSPITIVCLCSFRCFRANNYLRQAIGEFWPQAYPSLSQRQW
uniref:Putative secreted peptide n=1 Tax=Anopheles braziliensis TaxID=58242 RepID=A0A2M3ZVZ7_9DIPT